MAIKSPFAQPTVELAYAAYCKMPHTKREGFVKPKKADWIRANHEKWEAFQKPQDAPAPDINAMIQEAIANALGGLTEAPRASTVGTTPKVISAPKTVAAKATSTSRKAREKNGAARNAVLWRLNVEGLLAEAMEASPFDFITQKAGQDVLTRHFGEYKKAV